VFARVGQLPQRGEVEDSDSTHAGAEFNLSGRVDGLPQDVAYAASFRQRAQILGLGHLLIQAMKSAASLVPMGARGRNDDVNLVCAVKCFRDTFNSPESAQGF
jgi:hypothetical protein